MGAQRGKQGVRRKRVRPFARTYRGGNVAAEELRQEAEFVVVRLPPKPISEPSAEDGLGIVNSGRLWTSASDKLKNEENNNAEG